MKIRRTVLGVAVAVVGLPLVAGTVAIVGGLSFAVFAPACWNGSVCLLRLAGWSI